jgi:hypothetical protein
MPSSRGCADGGGNRQTWSTCHRLHPGRRRHAGWWPRFRRSTLGHRARSWDQWWSPHSSRRLCLSRDRGLLDVGGAWGRCRPRPPGSWPRPPAGPRPRQREPPRSLRGEPDPGRPEASPVRRRSRSSGLARSSQGRTHPHPRPHRSLQPRRLLGLRDRDHLCGGAVAEPRWTAHLPRARPSWSLPARFRSVRSSMLLPSVRPRGQPATGSRAI